MSFSKSSRHGWRHQKQPFVRQHFFKHWPEPQGQRSFLPSFSSSNLSPWTTCSPRFTCDSEGYPRRRLFIVRREADGVGFEPTVRANVRQFSRLVPSSTRPPIRPCRAPAQAIQNRSRHRRAEKSTKAGPGRKPSLRGRRCPVEPVGVCHGLIRGFAACALAVGCQPQALAVGVNLRR